MIKQVDKFTVQLTGFDLFAHLQTKHDWSDKKTIDFMKENNQDISFYKEYEQIKKEYLQKQKKDKQKMFNTKTATTTKTFDKYKQNLKADYHNVFSYNTKVAEIAHDKRTITPLGWWSVTTSKHINYVGSEYGYKVQKTN